MLKYTYMDPTREKMIRLRYSNEQLAPANKIHSHPQRAKVTFLRTTRIGPADAWYFFDSSHFNWASPVLAVENWAGYSYRSPSPDCSKSQLSGLPLPIAIGALKYVVS